MTSDNMLPSWRKRSLDAHKGNYGHVLIVAGSVGMSGAAVLSGKAALRSGAGLVTIACPSSIQAIVANADHCYMTLGLTQNSDGHFTSQAIEEIRQYSSNNNVIAIGPGLRQRADCVQFVKELLQGFKTRPLVLDADALNALAPLTTEFVNRTAPVILTPHPGEFARLIGLSVAEVQSERANLAQHYAKDWKCVLVLKGHETVITDGQRVAINSTGNPGMATGGSGDVLTGIIAALLGQGYAAFEAAQLSVWIHGRAGDLAAARLSQTALIATDIINHLPEVFLELEGR